MEEAIWATLPEHIGPPLSPDEESALFGLDDA
jgi:hypothetical protein